MAEKKTIRRGAVTVKRGETPKNFQIVTNQITTQSVNRSPKDIATWRNAHRSAESVHNPNRVALYDLYADVVLDGHFEGVWSKRLDSVLNKELHFMKGENKVDEMDDVIQSEKFRGVMRLIMEQIMWGLSGIEFIPGAELDFVEMERKHIKPDIGLYTWQQNGREGIPYNDTPNMWVLGNNKDLGKLLKVSPYALMKRGGIADWSQYVEIFGMPVRIVRYDAYDHQTKIELDKLETDTGSALFIRIPKQAEFEMMDGKSSNGDGQLQERFKNAMNNEMSVIVLGNTETTANDNGGSNAKAQAQADQQLEITRSDLKYVQNMLNHPKFIGILKTYGLPVDGGRFVFAKEIDRAAIIEQVGIVKEVKEMGVPVDDDYVYELTGIPKPKNYDKLKKDQEEWKFQDTSSPINPKKKRNTEDPENVFYEASLWNKWRQHIADFFDPPR